MKEMVDVLMFFLRECGYLFELFDLLLILSMGVVDFVLISLLCIVGIYLFFVGSVLIGIVVGWRIEVWFFLKFCIVNFLWFIFNIGWIIFVLFFLWDSWNFFKYVGLDDW